MPRIDRLIPVTVEIGDFYHKYHMRTNKLIREGYPPGTAMEDSLCVLFPNFYEALPRPARSAVYNSRNKEVLRAFNNAIHDLVEQVAAARAATPPPPIPGVPLAA